MAHYLVTGGAGFIGSHLAEHLLRNGSSVRIVDNLSTGRKSNIDAIRALKLAGHLDFVEGDIRSIDTCRRVCEGVEVVFHQAALASVQRSVENPSDTTAVNVCGTVHVLSAAREQGVRRVVLASSSSVYGDTPTLPKHEGMPTAPLSPYAAGKLAGEEFTRVFAKTLGVSAVSLRYFNVFGPRQDPKSDYAAVVPRFITALLNGHRPKVFGDGEQSRDFTYIDNVVQANRNAADRAGGAGEAVNIACGERYSLLTLLATLGRILGVNPAPEFLPARPGDVRHSQASIEKAQQLFGFRPEIGFEEGLRKTVEYFRHAA